MGIKKYFITKDSTITNAYDSFLTKRMTESNMGASDIMEVFVLWDRDGATSVVNNELSRALVYLDQVAIETDITNGLYDAANAKFYLKMFNAAHGETVPRNYTIQVMPLTRDWVEGEGLDMQNYSDTGGVCWLNASDTMPWATEGGDYSTGALFTQTFISGVEDLEIDITTLVNEWLSGSRDNHGLILKMQIEDAEEAFYTKKFFARKSHYFFHRPMIEVRYEEDSSSFSTDHRSESDGRNNFYFSSPLASSADNTNTLFLYNFVRGQLKDIPGYGSGGLNPVVRIYDDSRSICLSGILPATWVRTGVYSVDVILSGNTTDSPTLHDCWYLLPTDTDAVWVGDITTKEITGSVPEYEVSNKYETHYVIQIRDLKYEYRNDEVVRFRLFIREKDWKPNIYKTYWEDHSSDRSIVSDLYYKIVRPADNFTVIDYSHDDDSIDYSHVCYDDVSNYFTLDLSTLEPSFAYEIKFLYKSGSDFVEADNVFKFRVSDVGLWDAVEG